MIWLLVFKEDTMKHPNPGSKEAIDQGCICPVLDNCHGKGFPITSEEGELLIAYWMDNECPLHNREEFSKEKAMPEEG